MLLLFGDRYWHPAGYLSSIEVAHVALSPRIARRNVILAKTLAFGKQEISAVIHPFQTGKVLREGGQVALFSFARPDGSAAAARHAMYAYTSVTLGP
jgi:hypothetical protein